MSEVIGKGEEMKNPDEAQQDAPQSPDQESRERDERENVEGGPSERTQQAIGDIRRLTNQLIETSRASLFRAEEDRSLQGALQELRAVARDIGSALGLELRTSALPAVAAPQPPRHCGCEPPCEITSPDCCCFEIVLLRARVMKRQKLIESADAIPRSELELIFNVLADGQGEVYPSLTSYLSIQKEQKWVSINKTIRKICIRCGETRSVPLTVEVMEVEILAAGGRPEFGSNFDSLTLKCGCPTVPAQVSVELTGGGVAGGEVLVEVGARQL